MKNIQPGMDIERQVRKGCAAIDSALQEDPPNVEKASYTAGLVANMLEGYAVGIPQPWSQYSPMIAEEFDSA